MGLINKENIIKGFNLDNDAKIIIFNLLDKVETVIKNHEICFSSFVSSEVEAVMARILRSFSTDVSYSVSGGHDNSDYAMIAIYPEYLSEGDIEFPLSLLHIKTTNKSYEPSHRDVLGSVMGLGIKRDIVGDIIIVDKLIQMFVATPMEAYISANLEKISRNKCDITKVALESFVHIEEEFKIKTDTVKSLRLDSVIASGFNLSRSDALKMVKSSKVKVNHILVENASKMLEAGDLISCRGNGRILLSEIGTHTKKDRIKIILHKYS
jgi:RNA-binding protein YlmH